MAYNFSTIKQRLDEVASWLSDELSSIHTGRAMPALLDKVAVETESGTRSPIAHIATISTQDPRTLLISPWDSSQTKNIEKALSNSSLGVSVSVSGTGLRVFFPELTAERRKSFIKIILARLEDARISLRKAREEVWSDIQDKEKNGEISEDSKFKAKEELQKIVDEYSKKLEEATERKRKDIEL